jgi:hypothetical protein
MPSTGQKKSRGVGLELYENHVASWYLYEGNIFNAGCLICVSNGSR